jgi:hypothetical protein
VLIILGALRFTLTGTDTKLARKPVALRGREKFDGFEVTDRQIIEGRCCRPHIGIHESRPWGSRIRVPLGRDYLFYAYQTGEGKWYTDNCTRTTRLKHRNP